jgi:hypothetical protein
VNTELGTVAVYASLDRTVNVNVKCVSHKCELVPGIKRCVLLLWVCESAEHRIFRAFLTEVEALTYLLYVHRTLNLVVRAPCAVLRSMYCER